MLRWRLTAAAVILTPLVALLWLDDRHHGGHPGIWLAPVALLAGLMACHEVSVLLQKGNLATSSGANLWAVFVLLVASAMPVLTPAGSGPLALGHAGWVLVGVVLALFVLFGAELWRYREAGQSLQRLAGGTFGVLYAGLPLGLLIQLRIWSPDRLGLVAVVATILVVKLADTGAYFTGKSIGRHKLVPRLSPGKTVEGAVGAIGAAMLGAWIVYALLLPKLCPAVQRGAIGWYLLLGLSLALAGMAGDLAESLLKRDARCKDSSPWLPGLGGVLDILDSLLGAAPVSLAWWLSGVLAVPAG